MTFEQWLARVHREIAHITGGITGDDLVDYPYRDAYDNGESPEETAIAVLENDDLGAQFLEELEYEY